MAECQSGVSGVSAAASTVVLVVLTPPQEATVNMYFSLQSAAPMADAPLSTLRPTAPGADQEADR
jgi:hypothetical protein